MSSGRKGDVFTNNLMGERVLTSEMGLNISVDFGRCVCAEPRQLSSRHRHGSAQTAELGDNTAASGGEYGAGCSERLCLAGASANGERERATCGRELG